MLNLDRLVGHAARDQHLDKTLGDRPFTHFPKQGCLCTIAQIGQIGLMPHY